MLEHPVDELLARQIPPNHVLRLTRNVRGEDAPYHGLPVRPPEPRLKIGVLDSPAAHMFGAIEAVTEAEDRLLVLDALMAHLRIFDTDGHHLLSVGRFGRGPGEFVWPRSLSIARDGRLYVAEALGRINVFGIAHDSINFVDSFTFVGDLWDACIMDELLVIHGMSPGDSNILHAYAFDGTRLLSFGKPYPARSPIIRYQLSRGRIACLDQPEVVLHAPELIPQLHAYDRSGEFLWWMDIEGFEPKGVIETAAGASVMIRPDRQWHSTVSVVSGTAHDAFLLQIAEHTGADSSSSGQSPDLYTFVICPDERRGIQVGKEWPRIVGWVGSRVFAVREDLHPELLVFELDHTNWCHQFRI
jgi:hypothetical protein